MQASGSPVKVLIVKTSSIGDIMHALRVVQAIRERVTNLEISWVARRRYAKTVEACTAVDFVYPFRRLEGLGGFVSLVRTLRTKEFDYILDMEGLARSALMGWFSKGTNRIGRSDAREGATLFYKKMVPLPEDSRQSHPIDILLEFCKVFGCEPSLGSNLSFDFAESTIPKTVLGQGEVEIALCDLSPTTRDPFYGVDVLVESLLNSKLNCRILLLGDERSEARDDWDSSRVEDLRGQLDLEERFQRVTGASLVISSPGGPLHIASACGVRVIGLFGKLKPEKCGPYPLLGRDVGTVEVLSKDLVEVADEVIRSSEMLLSR